MSSVLGPACAMLLLLCVLASNAVTGQYNKMPSRLGGPRPNFTVSVDPPSRSLTVYVNVTAEVNVRVRLCYRQREEICAEHNPRVKKLVTKESPSVSLSFPNLLPCLCVQVYYALPDAVRTTVCPFMTLALDGEDVWRTSVVTEFDMSLKWQSLCPHKPAASLCWRIQKIPTDCLAIANSTLLADSNTNNPVILYYSISHVDKHPNMCVKLSLNSSSHEYCIFKEGHTKWSAEVVPASRHLKVYISSAVPASFSAQLCVIQGQECVTQGAVHSVSKDSTNKKELHLPFIHLQEELCVQVWQTDPLLYGWRLYCPFSSHERWGLVAVATSIVITSGIILAYLSYLAARRRLSAWQLSCRPVLLVCSSEQTDQLSAMCALASILQGDLCSTVHMAHLAPRGGGVADLGPLPWLYGQCESVLAAGGRVLVVWSPEGNSAFQAWCGPTAEGTGEREMEKRRKEKSEEDGGHMEPSGVTTSVLRAALAYLRGLLHGYGQSHGFALVCFEGLCCIQDIPKELKELPRYQLPRDFRALVKELHYCQADSRWRFCHRLFSAVQAYRVADRLAHKLQLHMPAAEDQRRKAAALRLVRRARPEIARPDSARTPVTIRLGKPPKPGITDVTALT
ncbi:interleukin-17 receptor E [Brienomyrus brachyistius]|uniref:interleukin-17 receptor E n=1 Tax=Brienomyrus brachyistius TaxID=42636 RepID=UPI0020B2A729|nr:interleukin-17 receptor E [Brienomyrus brachyistius]